MQEKTVTTIIGGGLMGTDIAAIIMAAGDPVHVVSRSASSRATLAERIGRACAKLPGTARVGELSVSASLAEVPWPQTGLVIEAVSEDLALKQSLFAQIDALADQTTLLTSNTSTFPISDVGQQVQDRSRLAGLHFFMPAHLVPLVEVIETAQTSSATIRTLMDRMQALGKRPIHVRKDIPGFVGNRIQHAMMREALYLVDDGVASAEDIDTAVRFGFGFRLLACGPMLQKEMSGWDTSVRAAASLYPSLHNENEPPQNLRAMVEEGHIGMKSGRGFWNWPDATASATRDNIEQALKHTQALLDSLPRARAGDD